MASRQPAGGQPTFRHRIQGIKLRPPESNYDIGGEIQADGTRVRKLKPIRKGRALEWNDLYTPCDVYEGSWITVQVREGHKITKDRLGYARYQVSQSDTADSLAIETESSDGGKPMFKVHIQVMGNESIERAYSEALEHAKVLLRQQGSTVKVRKIGEVFEKTSALSNAIAGLDPTGGAKAAVWVCVKAWENLDSQEREHEILDDLLEDLSRTIPTIDSVKSVADTNLKETVIDILRLIEDVLAFVLGAQSARGNRLGRVRSNLLNSGTQREVDTLVKRSERLRREFNERIGAQNLRSSELYRRRERLKELRPVELASYNTSRQCLDGTRVAIIDSLTAWAQEDGQPMRFAWIHGLAGLGKSSIMTSVCKRLDDLGALVCSFFCKRDSSDLRDPRRVLMTIVCELAQRWDAYGSAVAEVIRKNIGLHSKHMQPLYDALVAEPWKTISQAEKPRQTLAVIVDALDECGDPTTRRQLLVCLRDMSRLAPFLVIIVSSRPDEDIKRYFRHVAENQYLEVNLLQYDASADIHMFAQECFKTLASTEEWPSDAADRVVARANGLFIWARTACTYILTGLDHFKRLRLLTDGKPLTAIDALYRTILTTEETIGDEECVEEMRSTLGAIVATSMRSVLSVTTLAALMGEKASRNALQGTVDKLAAILYVDGELDWAIRISHPSFMDYITDPDRSKELCVDLTEQNAVVATRCLKVMESELKFNICNLETSDKLNRDVPDLNERVKNSISPQLAYACLYWSSHLAEAQVGILGPLLRRFLFSVDLIYWIEALSLLGRFSVAPANLLRALKWCTDNNMQDCCNMANDAYRFVLAFYDAISMSTPHLYISALALAPANSLISQYMRGYFTNLLKVLQGADKDWPTCIRSISVSSGVRAVATSPDGTWIVSGSEDGKVCIWDLWTGEAIRAPLEGHSMCVTCVSVSPDGRRIVSGSEDHTLRVWDVETGEIVLGALEGHSDTVTCVSYSPDGRIITSGSHDTTVRIWNAHTGERIGEELRGHKDEVFCLAVSPNSRQVASGSRDCFMRIWDLETGDTILGSEHFVHDGWVVSISFSSCGRRIVSKTDFGQVIVRCGETGRTIKVFTVSPTALDSTAPFARNAYPLLSSWRKSILVLNTETGMVELGPLNGHSDKICSIAFSPSRHHIVSGSKDRTIRVWSTAPSTSTSEIVVTNTNSNEYMHGTTCLAISSDGRFVVSGSRDHTVRVWDVETGFAVLGPLEGPSEPISFVAISPSDRIIFCGYEGGTLHTWDAKSGNPVLQPLRGHSTAISAIAFSPDGYMSATGSDDGEVRIWNSTAGETTLDPLIDFGKPVTSLAFFPDRQKLAVLCRLSLELMVLCAATLMKSRATRFRMMDEELPPVPETVQS
ncbi:hypothetical protein RhiJN_28951 [Ceratobasidium sp. AG-Ba]|nr:hypothetical protein RhiJN_28951 [Ceratobasidium sp. AG-Ba]